MRGNFFWPKFAPFWPKFFEYPKFAHENFLISTLSEKLAFEASFSSYTIYFTVISRSF